MNETNFLQLLLCKFKLLMDLAQVLIGVVYIIVVYIWKKRWLIKNMRWQVINH